MSSKSLPAKSTPPFANVVKPCDALFVGVIVSLLTIQILYSYANLNLVYSREAIRDGAYWRLLSGHFVHSNVVHLGMNCVVFTALYGVIRPLSTATTVLLSLLPIALLDGSLLYLFYPQLSWYVGISGALHGLALTAAAAMLREGRRAGYLLALAIAGKIVWEQSPWYNNQALASLIQLRVATEAHLCGALAATALIGIATSLRLACRGNR